MDACHPDDENLGNSGEFTVKVNLEEPKLLQDLRKIADDLDSSKKNIGYLQMNLADVCRIVEKLESNQIGQQLDPSVWKHLHDRVDKLESKTMLMIDIEEHLKQWNWMNEQINRIDMILQSNKKPFKCPICDGEGRILTTSDIMEAFEKREVDSLGRHFKECKKCNTKGIIWG